SVVASLAGAMDLSAANHGMRRDANFFPRALQAQAVAELPACDRAWHPRHRDVVSARMAVSNTHRRGRNTARMVGVAGLEPERRRFRSQLLPRSHFLIY